MSEKEGNNNEVDRDYKQEARDSRLRPIMRKNNEENFAECAKENGLMVVFNCRTQNSAMSACMEQHCNEEEFQKFLKAEGVTQKLRKKQSWVS
eukprot:gene26994-35698_t